MKLKNYVLGKWIEGDGDGQPLFDAVTGELIANATTRGLDFEKILEYGRKKGTAALRKMTFEERGRMLRALALHLISKKEKFYQVSYRTGATRADSWVDIDGGIGNLFSNASLRRKLPDEMYALDGENIGLGKGGTFAAQHILIPKEGLAVHINAYNFPVWGMLEKVAVNLLAGVAALVKPATVTSFLTAAVVEELAASGILPDGALQLVCGSARDILDNVHSQDVVTFTGSATTGLSLKSHANLLKENASFNLEADSLNCIVLGSDVKPGMPEWDIFVKEIRKEMTVKAGQKCTAIRRIFVAADQFEVANASIAASLKKTTIGDPRNENVRMGSLAGKVQREEVKNQIKKLLTTSEVVFGSLDSVDLLDADDEHGAFISPLLLKNEHPFESVEPHTVEAFGPVSTVMPYKSFDEAIELAKMGKGSLCSSIVTTDGHLAREFVLGSGHFHGRILILNRDCAKESTGHGSPLPMLVHGGPGRAGGGEEMGGLRGIMHYMQRVALQGSPDMLTAVTNVYSPGARGQKTDVHPFKKYFEELRIGDQLVSEEREITSEDIDKFADLSGDHFYAHIKSTNFDDTMFEHQVAHGYFIISAAAGLFVDGYEKNPVLLNYGIEELRFTKPVYPGDKIHVRFTCKEKKSQEIRHPKKGEMPQKGYDIPRGIVKWYVEILDNTDDPLSGVATILTMVRKRG